MDRYPTNNPIDQTPTEVASRFRTITTDLETGAESRRSLWISPKRRLRLVYNALTLDDVSRIWNFHQRMKGAFSSFAFQFSHKEEWLEEYIGKGDGAKTIWKLPVYSYEWLKIYKNEILQTLTTHYTISTDSDGFKQVTFVTAPAIDDVITIDFRGVPQIVARFTEDEIPKTIFTSVLTSMGLEIVEVKSLNT